jgi:hypothetical protein
LAQNVPAVGANFNMLSGITPVDGDPFSYFVGQDTTNPHPQIFVATSTECGNTSSQPRIEA